MENVKTIIKKHLMTVCAAISLVLLVLPFIEVASEASVAGITASASNVTNGFQCMNSSIFTLALIAGPVILAIMNYIPQLDQYKSILAVGVPGVCLFSLIIVYFQCSGAAFAVNSAASAAGGSVKVNLCIGAYLAGASYIATAIAGLVTYHNFTLDKEGIEKLKNDSLGFVKNVSDKAADAVNNVKNMHFEQRENSQGGNQDAGAHVASSTPAQQASSARIAPQKSQKARSADEIIALIERLSDMKNSGILTEEEFAEKKKALLEEI